MGDDILRHIKEARDTKAWFLSLADAQLTTLPPEIGQLTNLKGLRLGGNQLTALPPQIGQLTNLEELHIVGNRLAGLPPEIGQLTNLQTLDLRANQLAALPLEIGRLTKLQTLDLRDNQLTALPPEIGQLASLKTLYLTHNQLTALPPETGRLAELLQLTLTDNQLTALPPEISQLTNLQTLNLRNNQLTALPPEIGQLTKLRQLDLRDNPLFSPAPEIVSQGPQAILAYLREQHERGRRQWVSKLLVVGQGRAGKSAMLRSLLGLPFDPALPTTHGIQLGQLSLPHPVESGITMVLNTWDFGGQQIGHATHQFFLTNRSLFVLVWNAREGYEQARLEYWLDIIHAKAPESPVVIVAAHTDEWDADLPLTDLRASYPQIAAHCSISNTTGEGIDELREVLTDVAAGLPLMGEQWPATWLDAAEAIRERDDKHTTAQELLQAMADRGVQPGDAPILARLMHDLGDIMYYENDAELGDLVIVKPEWVSGYISRVLASKEVANNDGVFTADHMHHLWADLPPKMRDHFLRLMERFDLSYRTLDNREISLVVERLSRRAADYAPQWNAIGEAWPGREVGMRFHLHTIPPGIPTWFIARSHRFTTHIHWRFGALFADGPEHRHLALVRTNAHDRYLDLKVRGPCPVGFLTLLRDGIEVTLARFPGLPIERTIPCPGHKGQPCAHEFRYDDLQRAIEKEPPVRLIQCPVSFEDVQVARLLFGLHSRTQKDVLSRIEDIVEGTACRVDDLLTLTQREFAKQFARDQSFVESHCPPAFVLRPLGAPGWRESLVGQKMELQLWCQAPGEWHPACEKRRCVHDASPQNRDYDIDVVKGPSPEAGQYVIDVPAQWLSDIAPIVGNVVKVLKYVAPLAGPFVGVALPQYEELLKNDIKLMAELAKKLPAIEDDRAADLADDIGVHGPGPAAGAPLRALRKLLDEEDKTQVWGGLRKVLTPEHHYLWLCDYHAREYEV